MTPRSDDALTRDAITRAALELLDEVGLDALSTRRLASKLGVQSPALYWHFRNKQALVDAIGDEIVLARGMGSPEIDETWQQWITRRANNYRDELLAHRDGARVVSAKRGASPRVLGEFQREIDAMGDLGFSPGMAMNTIGVVSHYVTGFVLDEQSRILDRGAEGVGDSSRNTDAFDHGIRVIVAGTQAILADR